MILIEFLAHICWEVEELDVSELMPELILPEPAINSANNHEQQSGTIVKMYLTGQPQPPESRRQRLKKYLPPSPKALYDFVGLSQNRAKA